MGSPQMRIIRGAVISVVLLGWPMMVSADGGDTGLVHACINPNGLTRIITPIGSCNASETPVHWSATSPRTVPATFTVNCNGGETISAKFTGLIPGDTLLVSGTCNENVVIPFEAQRITLDGQGTATINGPDAATATLVVRGRGITIRGFTITGGLEGVRVIFGMATINDNTIQGTGSHGITVLQTATANINGNIIQNIGGMGSLPLGARVGIRVSGSSSAGITNNAVQDNPADGVVVDVNSSAFIASNTIQNHGRDGIFVFRSSSVSVQGNTISNNSATGVKVQGVSQASIGGGNTINGNGSDGIFVNTNSDVDLGQGGPNTTTVNNGGFGIRCESGSHASGDVGTLNGNSGQTNAICDY
jgi:parallel beta-helix repeat protein